MQVRAAVSPLTRDIVMGPARPARVLAVFPTAVYLAVDGGDHEGTARARTALPGTALPGTVLPVVTADALLLPTALRLGLSSRDVRWSSAHGDEAVVGGGGVVAPGLDVRVAREWRPSRVRSGLALPGETARELLGHEGVLAGLCADLTRAGLRGEPVDRQVGGLVGAGVGLTPSGDDALCGVLLALRAWGPQRRGIEDGAADARAEPAVSVAVASVVDAVARNRHRTTSLSASLLTAAAAGFAVPQVSSLVEALSRSNSAAGRSLVVTALEAVHGIGHSSGRDLVAGLAGALHSIESTIPPIESTIPTIERAGPASPRPEGTTRG